jgi:hypothetical protein
MENLTSMEMTLEKRLDRVHANMKDFSYVLLDVMEKKREQDEREAAARLEQEKIERSKRRDEKRTARREEKIRLRRDELGLDGDESLDGSITLSHHESEDASSIAGNTLGSNIRYIQDQEEAFGDPAMDIQRIEATTETADFELDEYGEPIVLNEESEVKKINVEEAERQGDAQSVTSELTGAGGGSLVGGMGPVATPGPLPTEDPEKVIPVIGELTIGPPLPEDPHSFTVDEVADRLISLSLYCGFANLRLDEAPEDVNYEYEFDVDNQNRQLDDKWLSMSFFISTTKSNVDAIKGFINKQYDPVAGALKVDNLHSVRMAEESLTVGESIYREQVFLMIQKIFIFIFNENMFYSLPPYYHHFR